MISLATASRQFGAASFLSMIPVSAMDERAFDLSP